MLGETRRREWIGYRLGFAKEEVHITVARQQIKRHVRGDVGGDLELVVLKDVSGRDRVGPRHAIQQERGGDQRAVNSVKLRRDQEGVGLVRETVGHAEVIPLARDEGRNGVGG